MRARTRYGLGQAVSTDAGRTWREWDEPFTKSFNVNPRFLRRKLASGNLLLVANDDPKKRANLTAMLSADDGAVTRAVERKVDPLLIHADEAVRVVHRFLWGRRWWRPAARADQAESSCGRN